MIASVGNSNIRVMGARLVALRPSFLGARLVALRPSLTGWHGTVAVCFVRRQKLLFSDRLLSNCA